MIRPILRYGERPLHRRADLVQEVTADIQALIDDMIETMYAAPGIGLAAPQVGMSFRIFVADMSGGRDSADLIVMINPELLEQDGTQLEDEGCLSMPGFNAEIARPARIVVKGLDHDGREHKIEAAGLLARAVRHEMDHLDGTLFVDHLHGIKRDLILRRIGKLKRTGKW